MDNSQGRLPIILSILFVVIILALSVIKLRNWEGVRLFWGITLILLYLCWLFVESRVALAEMGREETTSDRGSCELYAAARGVTVVSALIMPTQWIGWGGLHYGGIALFTLGVGFRLVAIKALGEGYSHRVRRQSDYAIVTTGPYGIVRHPAYIGMLVAHLGFVLFFWNWVSLVVLLGLFLPCVVVRILIEEKALLETESYIEYSKTRKRLIPHLW